MTTPTTQVPPLRVQKGSSNVSSPTKPTAFAQGRPLSDLSPMALRRNSPSFPRNSLSKHESSPATSSPFNAAASPKMFWQHRDPSSPASENRSPFDNVSPSKRSSIENLKKASRVKNSSMFAKEQSNNYDPSSPKILDGRPLRNSLQGNAFMGRGSFGPNSSTSGPATPTSPSKMQEHQSTDDTMLKSSNNDIERNADSPYNQVAPLSPSKTQASPTKSSLSKKTGAMFRRSGFDPSTGIWEDEDEEGEKTLPAGRRLHRHAKSVTFDQAPPQINEYEMTTPDPSSVASGSREGSYESFDDDDDEEYSFERGSSFDPHDDSFDASLEDIEKTPVVLPEDWRFMSPENANNHLVRADEDVFDDALGSPPPEARPGSSAARQHQPSTQSIDSNGQSRPLPPLPPQSAPTDGSPSTSQQQSSLSGTLERMSGAFRALPSPPPAANVTAADIRRMSNGTFSLEDRLKMMALNESTSPKAEADAQRERRMRRAGSKDVSPVRDQYRDSAIDDAQVDSQDEQNASSTADRGEDRRLSRDFILAQLRAGADDISRSNSQYSTASLDPDVAIPSREDPTQTFDDDYNEESVIIKDEPIDDDELYKIPEMYRKTSSQLAREDEAGSEYSESSIQRSVDMNADTPRAQTPVEDAKRPAASERMSLPDFMGFGADKGFDFGLDQYISRESPSPPRPADALVNKPVANALPDLAALRSQISRPFTPDQDMAPPKPTYAQEDVSEPGTPSSVIRHPVAGSPSPSLSPELEDVQKTLSNTGSISSCTDSLSAPREEIPVLRQEGEEIAQDNSSSLQQTPEPEQTTSKTSDLLEPIKQDKAKRVSSLVQLDLAHDEAPESLGLGLEAAFDRVLETQKRGYLMRQNTKVVVATERACFEDSKLTAPQPAAEDATAAIAAPNEVVESRRKTSQPAWVAEPWNNKSRRRSIRVNGEPSSRPKSAEGAVPPVPGLPSNVAPDLSVLVEDELAEEEADDFEDGAERGRLFVKVVGVKDLQLPFPTHEQTSFALTLDNGLHCVTTSWLNLARAAPIGQEFELIVLNELEFQLTLQMKLEEPPRQPVRPESPTKAATSPKKQNAFGRLFGSPKKKKESDIRPQEPTAVKRPVTPPSAYELVQGIVAKDGSFARAYVSLTEYEKQAFGRPATVDVACFNEWAMEEVPVGSSRSKKGVIQLQRRPPYEIGKLELQLLYVPKPKGAKDEDMPKSMNGAIRAMRDAEERAKQQSEVKEFEGFLSQQGGDCPYWRRRFFKLVGTKLTAYHETSRQPRATINLAKAAKLIDDKANLAQKEVSTKKGGRRKSAFAEDEEGYMFVEEGFRVRFANGEVIDFYAENAASKDEWMAALSQVVGKQIAAPATNGKGWTDMVFKREKSVRAKTRPAISDRKSSKDQDKALPARPVPEATRPFHNAVMTGALQAPFAPPQQSASSRPSGHTRTESYQTDQGVPRSQANSPTKARVGREERHRKTKSMWS